MPAPSIDWLFALIGGMLIGIAASIMLIFSGRVLGVSGILQQALFSFKKDSSAWQWMFLLGLLFGGLTLDFFSPEVFSGALTSPWWTLIVAGLLVGFGTALGSGCTSGHGVCGISRMSIRSIVATLVFMSAGILSVFIFRQLWSLI